jgi:MoaA/NifB/PqqE/SkfB family radical SAM enzyme
VSLSTLNYWKNLVRLARRDPWLHPRVVTYYVTTACNLNCIYCEDFGAQRNGHAAAPLPLVEALKLLDIIRRSVDSLILTGGEPLLYPDIVELVNRARRELNFRQITLLTNGLLLPQAEALLPGLSRLVISLDAINPAQWSAMINAPLSAAQTILDHIRRYAGRQREFGYRLIVNSVLTPETLPGAHKVLDFCVEHNLLASFSPQAVCNWPRYDLLVSDAYKAFLAQMMDVKRRGGPILGSLAYLRTLRELRPYACYPTLAPRVMPGGDLVYPCRPVEKAGGSHGGRPCNLLEAQSLERAFEIALSTYGPPPRICTSCFQQCFAEPSLMQAQPLALLSEWLLYRPSREAGLGSYAPG